MKDTNSNIPLKLFLYLIAFTILAPLVILVLWTFTSRWPWPNLFPTSFSLRALEEVFAPYANLLPTLVSSILLSLTVALLSAIVGTMTARALVFYDFFGKGLIKLLTMAPNIVPGTVFAMGIHVVFIRMSLADTLVGVIIVHLIYTLPYSINIMRDLTSSIGQQMELQAYVLGASPLKSFIYITLPLLAPGVLASMNMAYITSFSQYFLTLLIGGGKIRTLSTLMVPFIAKGDRSIGSAYALIFVLSTLTIFIVMDRVIKRLSFRNKEENL
ncbi:ABC transporter permease subunit [Tissierella creatinini]|nr:ABC transporter permease subunit [Tissierella creatinini]TJX60977.1 ABC transporter permease subunit [Soehngenia saccharolytica]